MVYKLIDSTQAPLQGFNLQNAPNGIRSKEPLRSLFTLLAALEALTIHLPLRTLIYILAPRLRPHPKWTLARSLFVSVYSIFLRRTFPLNLRSNTIDKSVMPQLPSNADATAFWIQPVNRQTGLQGDLKYYFEAGACITTRVLGYWYGENHAGKSSRRPKEGEKVYLHFHGGGYWQQSSMPQDYTTNVIRQLLRASSQSPNKKAPKRLLAVEYRLSNETTFPGMLADALAGWVHLVHEGFEPKNIVLTGDSAGGNLALALARYIRDYRPLYDELGLSNEGAFTDGLILFSPWIDMSLSYFEAGPSSSGVRNASTDFLSLPRLRRARNAVIKGLPVPAVVSRWLSCVSADREIESDIFDEFPRALVFGGASETFIDEIRAFHSYYNATAEEGRCGRITLEIEPLASHDWNALPYGFQDEQKRTVKAIARWI